MVPYTEQLPPHIFVLVHGNNGHPSDFDIVANAIRARFPPGSVAILQSSVNERRKTRAGIKQCGENLALEILAWLRTFRVQGRHQLSILGHSFGGLIARYCLPFVKYTLDAVGIAQVSFATLCTPHLGSRKPGGTLQRVLSKWLVHAILSTHCLYGQTGRDLLVHRSDDDLATLEAMSVPDSPFVEALSAFAHRTAVGLVTGDHLVAHAASTISLSAVDASNCAPADEWAWFVEHEAFGSEHPVTAAFPSPPTPHSMAMHQAPKLHDGSISDAQRHIAFSKDMLTGLQTLPWRRLHLHVRAPLRHWFKLHNWPLAIRQAPEATPSSTAFVALFYNVVLTQLQEQLYGLTKRGSRAQVAKLHAKLGAHYINGGFIAEAIGQFENELAIRKELKEIVAQESCMNNLGTVHLQARDPEAAISWFEQALGLATQRANTPAQCLVQYNLALAHHALGSVEEAAQIASNIVGCPEPIDEALRISALQVLAMAASAMRNGSFLEYATLAFEKAETLGDPETIERCANALALHHFEQRQWPEAAVFFERCLDLAVRAKDAKKEAVAHYHLGVLFAAMSQRKVAEAHFLIGLEKAKEANAAELTALIQANVGLEYLYHEDIFVAKAEFNMALQKARFAGSHAVESFVLTGLGHVLMMESHVDDAAKLYAADLVLDPHDRPTQLRAQSNLAVAALVAGDLDRALDLFRTNSRTAAVLGNKREMSRAYFGMGAAAKEMKRRGLALAATDEPAQLFIRQRNLAIEAGDKRLEILALRELVTVHDMAMAFEKAQDECDELINAALDLPGETVHLMEAYRCMANILSSQLSLLTQRGSRFHDTIKVLMRKRDEAIAKYKQLSDAPLVGGFRRQEIEFTARAPYPK
ncbi:hypothetical protein ACHHYP_03590 [Achlya hypogyna]|uniref:DUF676 domain-containing protein n=1 Tax=Achlya hypogyna TaxID=1202772 RepID=A0A1V9ZR24_ACHHY|nr:hypothetical protein ACHHYP_03590 [Achlya hypogyna]